MMSGMPWTVPVLINRSVPVRRVAHQSSLGNLHEGEVYTSRSAGIAEEERVQPRGTINQTKSVRKQFHIPIKPYLPAWAGAKTLRRGSIVERSRWRGFR
jgi:hypothetical protein